MKQLRAMTNRTLRVYFRDRSAVFFSMLAVLIIIGIYMLFLGDVWTSEMDFPGARTFMDSWIMSGLLAVSAFTSTMGAFAVMVTDRQTKISKDFYSAPVKRSKLAAGYIAGAYIIGLTMTTLTMVIAFAYILIRGGELPSAFVILKLVGCILLTALSNTSFIFLLVSFLKTANSFATFSSIIGTVIGFVSGIYIPMSALPGAVQTVVLGVPVTHAASLFRQIMLQPLSGDMPEELRTGLYKELGVRLYAGGEVVSSVIGVLVLAGSALLFFSLSVFSLSRKQKN